MNKAGTPFQEALKEVARYIILGIVSWLLTGGLQILLGFFQASLSPELMETIIIILILALRGLDKYLHLQGVETGKVGYLGVRGITYI